MAGSADTPVVLIPPEARAALLAEAERGSLMEELSGGLLFGYPCDERQRMVIDFVRLKPGVGFGSKRFSLERTRTSQQLDRARNLDPKATYCGVWYIHRTPNQELTDEEWRQAQSLLEDPDFRFQDLVCLVLCFYGGRLNIHASLFSRYHSARGQAPTPTELRLTTDWLEPSAAATHPSVSTPGTEWYKAPEAVDRIDQERERLADRYHVEPALAPNGQMYFRLSPKQKYENLSFYLAAGPGFPDKAPHLFLLVGGKPHPISTPSLVAWSSGTWLVQLADELVQWLAFSTDEYLTAAEEALKRGQYHEAADLLTVVLAIDPRTPGAARLLARAQARLRNL
jgi:hypothetical protein